MGGGATVERNGAQAEWRMAGLCGVALLVSLAARLFCQSMAMEGWGAGTLWPGCGVLLGLCLAQAGTRRDIAALAIGSTLATLIWYAPDLALGEMLLRLTSSLVAGLLAFAILRRFADVRALFDEARGMGWFVAACAGSAAAVALLEAVLRLGQHGGFVLTAVTTFAAALLGLLVLTPIVAIVADPDARRRLPRGPRAVAEMLAVLILTASVTALIFLPVRLPVLFLTFPTVLIAAFRLRQTGAAAAVLVVSLISTYATSQGLGPIARMVGGAVEHRLMLQVYLGCCFLSALPVAVLIAQGERRARATDEIAQRFKMVVENIGEVIFQVDAEGCWVYLNPAWQALTGAHTADSLTRSWLEWVDPADRAELVERTAPVLAGERASVRRSVRFLTPAGVRWTELFVQRLCDADGAPIGAIGTLRDIDDRKRLEEHVVSTRRQAEQRATEARLIASTDELTGLASRRAFLRQLDREIAGAAEFDWPLAVAIFDVDHFKAVNDRHGHAVGDRVLQQIARRAESVLRSGDLIGRLGGEEFAIIMPGATATDAAAVAERLRAAVEQRGAADIALPAVTVSIGIAEREGQRVGTALLSAADAALYQAKDAGRNRVRVAA